VAPDTTPGLDNCQIANSLVDANTLIQEWTTSNSSYCWGKFYDHHNYCCNKINFKILTAVKVILFQVHVLCRWVFLEIGSTWAERVGQEKVGGCTQRVQTTWPPLDLALENTSVGSGWGTSVLLCTNRLRKQSSHLVWTSFWQGSRFPSLDEQLPAESCDYCKLCFTLEFLTSAHCFLFIYNSLPHAVQLASCCICNN